jgi:CBS domain-containing protein
MNVNELMTSDVSACGPDTDLASVARIMWDCDCGIVPVVNEERKVLGVITDRDICIATATRAVAPSQLHARDVMSGGELYSCAPGDDAREALDTMKQYRVRRLPVLDESGRLAGIISLNDLVMRAECRTGAAVPGEQFLETLKSICAHSTETVSA